jgi:hypothetical protein
VAQFKLTSVHFIKILLHETWRKSEPTTDRIESLGYGHGILTVSTASLCAKSNCHFGSVDW